MEYEKHLLGKVKCTLGTYMFIVLELLNYPQSSIYLRYVPQIDVKTWGQKLSFSLPCYVWYLSVKLSQYGAKSS